MPLSQLTDYDKKLLLKLSYKNLNQVGSGSVAMSMTVPADPHMFLDNTVANYDETEAGINSSASQFK